MKNKTGLVREDVINVGKDLNFPPLTEAQINIVLSRVDGQADSDPTGNWRVWVEDILYDVVPKPIKKKFKKGDRVRTSTHAVYQNTQDSLNNLTGIVMNTDDYPYNIHVKLDNKPTWGNVGFSEFELTKTDEKRELLEDKLRMAVMTQMALDIEIKDVTAIDELLTFVPVENLIQYLSEEEWTKYKKLWKPKK